MTSQPQHHCRYADRTHPLRYISEALCGYLWSVTNRHITSPSLPRSSLADDCRKGQGECQPSPAALATNLPFDLPPTDCEGKREVNMNGNALFLRNFKEKVGKIRRRVTLRKRRVIRSRSPPLTQSLNHLVLQTTLSSPPKEVTPLLGTEEKCGRLLSIPALPGGAKNCGYINQLYYNGADEYE